MGLQKENCCGAAQFSWADKSQQAPEMDTKAAGQGRGGKRCLVCGQHTRGSNSSNKGGQSSEVPTLLKTTQQLSVKTQPQCKRCECKFKGSFLHRNKNQWMKKHFFPKHGGNGQSSCKVTARNLGGIIGKVYARAATPAFSSPHDISHQDAGDTSLWDAHDEEPWSARAPDSWLLSQIPHTKKGQPKSGTA